MPKPIPKILMQGNAKKTISKISITKSNLSKRTQSVLITSETLKFTNHKISCFRNNWLFKLLDVREKLIVKRIGRKSSPEFLIYNFSLPLTRRK